MAKFYKITVPVRGRKGSRGGRNAWINIGLATRLEGKDGFICRLDAIPINWDGEFSLYPVPGVETEVVEEKGT